MRSRQGAGRAPSGSALVDAVLVTLTRMDSVKFCSVKGVYDTVSIVRACTHAAHVRPPGHTARVLGSAASRCSSCPQAASSSFSQQAARWWCCAVLLLYPPSQLCRTHATAASGPAPAATASKLSQCFTEYSAMYLWHTCGACMCHRYMELAWTAAQGLYRDVPQPLEEEGAHRLHCEAFVW